MEDIKSLFKIMGLSVIAICLVIGFIVGIRETGKAINPPWMDNRIKYVCTPEQELKVKEDTIWCNRNTSFSKNYCYCSSIENYCKLKEEKK